MLRKKWITRIVVSALIISLWGLLWYGVSAPSVATQDILVLQSDDWVKGNQKASVVLIEYLDFECESCGACYPVVQRLSEEFGSDVAFVSRYFPLPGHKNSMTSARAVEAAGKQGKYWEMYDILFKNQGQWGERSSANPEIFEQFAERIGLDLVRFKNDVDSDEVKNRIERDKDAGDKLDIRWTPSFFLNGEYIKNPRGYEEFKALLQDEIRKSKEQ